MKFFTINKNQSAFLVTLMILIFLGALYFFIYLPGNEKQIQEHRFSALQNIDRNIHTKIENSIGLLNNLLSSYDSSNDEGRKDLENYIREYSSNNFRLTAPQIIKLSEQKRLRDSADLDSAYTIHVNNDTREINLVFSKLKTAKADTTVYRIGMKFSFDQFIKFLLPKDVFDDYIVFSKDKAVYESFPAGFSYAIDDSLLNAKEGIGGSVMRSQLISGVDYKMFLQPVGFDASNEWIIAGLLSNKHYQKEKTQLPTQMVLLLATIMLIAMVAFPWLKLYQMGSKDRLTIFDGIASIFISMILMSLIFFVFFNYNVRFRPPLNKDPKTNLATAVHEAFKSELDTVYKKLQQFDGLVKPGTKDIVNLGKDAITYADGIIPAESTAIKSIAAGIKLNQVFWLNKKGDEVINWTADNMNAPHGNFKSRAYFNKIEADKAYISGNNKGDGFFLEQVISWTSGTFRSVISKKSKMSTPDSLMVVALSFNFKSLSQVILPTGYLLAVSDNAGNVLYHSEPTRNLNENLLKVFSKSDKLKSCLDAGVQGDFATKYYGNDYEVQVKPVDGLPYFIVILEDAVYSETKDMEIYSFTFSMLFFFFGFLVLQLLAIFLVSAKRSFFKKQLMDTSWIGPKISSQREYVLATVFNAIVILLLMLFFNLSSFLQYIFVLLFSVTAVPMFLNGIFARRYGIEKKNILQFKKLTNYCMAAFMILINVVAFKMLSVSHFFGFVGYEVLVLLTGIGLYSIRSSIFNLAIRLRQSRKYGLLLGSWNYVNSFTLMAFSRLIVTSGLPIVFFYISAHNFEQNLAIRYKQLNFANQLLGKFAGTSPDSIVNAVDKWKGVYYDSSFIWKVSVVDKDEALKESNVKPYTAEELNSIRCLSLFRLHLTDKSVSEDKFYTPGAEDRSFFYNHLLKESAARGSGTVTYRQSAEPGRYLKFQSENLNYHYPSVFQSNGFNAAIFWFLFIGVLVGFYFIIYSIVKKLFSLNLPDLEVWKKMDNEILVNKTYEQPLFVIGLPGSGKKNYLLNKIRNGEIKIDNDTPYHFNHPEIERNNVFIAELINIPSTGREDDEKMIWEEYCKQIFDKKNRLIIVNHFEYNIQDPLSNRYKLEFLERLFLENKYRIVILSTIHPVAFLDSAMEHHFQPEDKSTPGQDLERWHVLLGHYRIVVLPLQLGLSLPADPGFSGRIIQKNTQIGIPDIDVKIKDTDIKIDMVDDGRFILPIRPMPFTMEVSSEGYNSREIVVNDISDLKIIELEPGPSFKSAKLIRQETHHTYFLKKAQAPAFRAGRGLSESTRIAKFDELAFKLQVSSHYFYMYIWQSLTKEEKFLLYDLAEDNLVNAFDDYNLSMLIAKGVVIRPDGTLKLFNKGFRNFILTAIGNSEAIKIKNQIKDNGNWNTLKNPLQLIILAILGFLLVSQEEAFAKLITYVATLGAGVPVVLKLFTLFDKTEKQAS